MADIYRRNAPDGVLSPEQLDKAITVTSPMSWLALAAVTLMVIAAAVWSVVGTVPVTVSSLGIVAEPNGTNSVYAPEAGRIVEICVSENQTIRSGEVVAKYQVGNNGRPRAICAAQAGVVTKITASIDSDVNRGDDILRFSPAFAGEAPSRVVVCYVRQADAGRLRPGMRADAALQSADSRTYGVMRGRIVCIDEYPATREGMGFILGSENGLSTVFRADSPAVVAVTCQLEADPGSQSGFAWSNRRGAEQTVEANAIVEVRFIVDEVPPISRLFSVWRDKGEGKG